MKNFSIKIFVISTLIAGSLFFTKDALAAVVPTLSSTSVASITAKNALASSKITADGGSPVTVSGFVWGTSTAPTTLNAKTISGSKVVGAPWSETITSLKLGLTYYVRAYATNVAGTGYGSEFQFTTPTLAVGSGSVVVTVTIPPEKPKITNAICSNITSNSMTVEANITSAGTPAVILARGTCLSLNGTPSNCAAEGGTTTGSFIHLRTGLTPNTTYTAYGYASNATGTTWSSGGVSCTTLAPSAPDLTAGPVDKASAIVNVPTTFFTIISNEGTANAGAFDNFFQVCDQSAQGKNECPAGATLTDKKPVSLKSLKAGVGASVVTTYTFPLRKVYSMRVCADKSDRNTTTDTDSITEYNLHVPMDAEDNNCGNWRDITAGMPDLVASAVVPTDATVGVPLDLSTTITNMGNTDTVVKFPNAFQFCDYARVKEGKDWVCPGGPRSPVGADTNPMKILGSKDSGSNTGIATYKKTFDTVGTFAVRACADFDTDWQFPKVTEGNSNDPDTGENNNCGEWKDITVNPVGSVGTWSYIPDCNTACGAAQQDITQTCVGGTCTGTPATKTCPATAACPGPGAGDVEIYSFTANPSTILKGRSSTLTWVTNADRCDASQDNNGTDNFDTSSNPSGSDKVTPQKTTKYTLSCTKGSKKGERYTPVKVIIPVVIEN